MHTDHVDERWWLVTVTWQWLCPVVMSIPVNVYYMRTLTNYRWRQADKGPYTVLTGTSHQMVWRGLMGISQVETTFPTPFLFHGKVHKTTPLLKGYRWCEFQNDWTTFSIFDPWKSETDPRIGFTCPYMVILHMTCPNLAMPSRRPSSIMARDLVSRLFWVIAEMIQSTFVDFWPGQWGLFLTFGDFWPRKSETRGKKREECINRILFTGFLSQKIGTNLEKFLLP